GVCCSSGPAMSAPATQSGRTFRSRRLKLTSAGILLLLSLVLWGYVVGPLIAPFQRSLAGESPLSEYTPFLDFGSVQNEAMRGSLWISFLSVISAGVVGILLAVLLNRWD